MILKTFLSMLLLSLFQSGESSSWPLDTVNDCTKLIKEGGQIACNLTGEGDYDRMSVGNCWVTCTQGSNMFMLPDDECRRVLEPYAWAGYQKMFGKLPPFGFQECNEYNKKRLTAWVEKWKKYRKIAMEALCSK
uniref:Putative ixodes 10 kDa peptide protein n=1 Tax=Ixodes ricinus TaxID=34613 RepID=A0A0K8R3L6_IXORI